MWDDVYDVWVRELGLSENVYAHNKFNPDFAPAFDLDIKPIFVSSAMQKFNLLKLL